MNTIWMLCLFPAAALNVVVDPADKAPPGSHGIVTVNGVPIDGATVVFHPEDNSNPQFAPRQANGLTDKRGYFSLETVADKGIRPGAYRVTIYKKVYPPGVKPPDRNTNMMEMMKAQQKMVEIMPRDYTHPTATPLRFEVKERGKNFFEIKFTVTHAAVEGKLTLDGQPLPSATIMLIPGKSSLRLDETQQASALTDANGHFRVESPYGIGAVPGQYKVVVTKKVLPPGIKPPDPKNAKAVIEATKIMRESVPKLYTDERQTPIVIEVSKEDVKVEIALTS